MNQTEIDFAAPAQNTDTSRAAAKAIQPVMNQLQEQIWCYLQSCKPGVAWDSANREVLISGATDHEMQRDLGMIGSTQRPRRKEIQERGLVIDSGFRRPTNSSRMATVWRCV